MSDPRHLLIFPDTNVLIQGRALREQPWAELGRDAIDIMLCGPVVRELDRLKTRPGRAGKVARAISTKVRELMRTIDKSETLREANPRVTLRLAVGKPNKTAVREGIDLSHDDQAIINEALARLDVGDHAVLLTDDNFAAMTAEHFGLPVQLLPGHWLKEAEPDDSTREIAKRDTEIARLKAAEPALQLRFANNAGAEIDRLDAVMKRYQPVSPSDVDRLVERVAAIAPMVEVKPATAVKAAQPRPSAQGFDIASIAYSSLGMMPVTQAAIDKYEANYRSWISGIRSKLAAFHNEWNRRRDWPQAVFFAANVGLRPAEDVLVEIAVSGDFKMSGVQQGDDDDVTLKPDNWLQLPLPPAPPRLRSRAEELMTTGFLSHDTLPLLTRPHFPTMPLRRNDDDFYWRRGKADPTDTMSLECKSWRHGRDEEDFAFRVWAGDKKDVQGLIVGRISASNISEPLEKRLPLRIAFNDRECLTMAETLVDEFEKRVVRLVR